MTPQERFLRDGEWLAKHLKNELADALDVKTSWAFDGVQYRVNYGVCHLYIAEDLPWDGDVWVPHTGRCVIRYSSCRRLNADLSFARIRFKWHQYDLNKIIGRVLHGYDRSTTGYEERLKEREAAAAQALRDQEDVATWSAGLFTAVWTPKGVIIQSPPLSLAMAREVFREVQSAGLPVDGGQDYDMTEDGHGVLYASDDEVETGGMVEGETEIEETMNGDNKEQTIVDMPEDEL